MVTSAFFTFDPIRIDAEELIMPIIKSIGGEHSELLQLINSEDLFPSLVEGENSRLDQATMLFLSSLDWKEGGGIPEQLGKNNIKTKNDLADLASDELLEIVGNKLQGIDVFDNKKLFYEKLISNSNKIPFDKNLSRNLPSKKIPNYIKAIKIINKYFTY